MNIAFILCCHSYANHGGVESSKHCAAAMSPEIFFRDCCQSGQRVPVTAEFLFGSLDSGAADDDLRAREPEHLIDPRAGVSLSFGRGSR